MLNGWLLGGSGTLISSLNKAPTNWIHRYNRGRPTYIYIYIKSKVCHQTFMPRKARIDASEAVHHFIVRGMERGIIFRDDADRNDFFTRLGKILIETKTRCFAWTLIPNHFHLLLKTGSFPVATVMGRLLTGYAMSCSRTLWAAD